MIQLLLFVRVSVCPWCCPRFIWTTWLYNPCSRIVHITFLYYTIFQLFNLIKGDIYPTEFYITQVHGNLSVSNKKESNKRWIGAERYQIAEQLAKLCLYASPKFGPHQVSVTCVSICMQEVWRLHSGGKQRIGPRIVTCVTNNVSIKLAKSWELTEFVDNWQRKFVHVTGHWIFDG